MALNFPTNPEIGDTYTSGNTTWQYNGTVWNILIASSVAAVTPNTFSSVTVTGQNAVSADQTDDTLTFVAGSNMTIITDPATDTITFSSTAQPGTTSNSFETIEVAGQPNVAATSATDILTLAAGSGIVITTNAETDTITFSNSAVTTFRGLSDSTTANNLSVDQFYLPAITKLRVYNSGATAYLTDQYPGNNPTIYAIGGTTIAFDLDAAGHPFQIQDGAGNNYDAGLIHVAIDGTVSTEENAQGKDSGTLYWKIPSTISGGYRYQCSVHAPMVGSIVVKNIVSL